MVKSNDYAGGLYEAFRFNAATNRMQLIESMYYRIITELACNRFKWSGFPDKDTTPISGDIRPRYIELSLFRYALVVFFHHKKWDKFLALRAANPGPLDMYFDPTAFHVYGNGNGAKTSDGTPANGIDGLTVSAKEAVPIWGNYLRVPELDMVGIYANRMATIDRTIEINAMNLRHPTILATDAETKGSLMEIYKQIQDGQPVISVRTDFQKTMSDKITALNLGIDKELISNLLIDKRKMWNECLTFLGINNANQDKRERLVAAEVSSNDSEVLATRRVSLDARQEACRQINARWGLSVAVEWNVEVDDMKDMPGLGLGVDALDDAERNDKDGEE